MADKVVVDCSLPDKKIVANVSEAAITSLVKAALAGRISTETRDTKIAEIVSYVTDVGALPDRVQVIPLTAAEETLRQADETEGLAQQAAHETEDANANTLRDRADAALAKLTAGADATKNGSLFADRTAQERGYLELLGRSDAALIRLLLRKLDSTD